MADQDVTRRNFMVRAIIGIFVFIGAALAVPFGGFGILPALNKKDAGWHMRHFRDPQALSPGSIMPKVLLPEKELKELTDYMMSLK